MMVFLGYAKLGSQEQHRVENKKRRAKYFKSSSVKNFASGLGWFGGEGLLL